MLDETLSFVMDFDCWLRAGLEHKIAYYPETLAGLRLHATAKSVAQLGRFAAELVQIYQNLFNRDDLPEQIRAVQREAMANIHHRAADCAFWAGDFATARQHIKHASRHRPWPPRSLWLWVYAGPIGLFLAERIYGNPYLAGMEPS